MSILRCFNCLLRALLLVAILGLSVGAWVVIINLLTDMIRTGI